MARHKIEITFTTEQSQVVKDFIEVVELYALLHLMVETNEKYRAQRTIFKKYCPVFSNTDIEAVHLRIKEIREGHSQSSST